MTKKVEGLILGMMCFILTVGICIQVKTVSSYGVTIGGSQKESELRDQVLKMKERYEEVYGKLQETQKEIEKARTEVSNNNQELKELDERIKKVNILLGLTDVQGAGVSITVTDAPSNIITNLSDDELITHNTDLLAIVNELKNAGAEAIDINGQRIIATTAITCEGNVIAINGERVTSTFTINAIGLPELMATLNRPGGYLQYLERDNIKTTLKKMENIQISKYNGIINFKYASAE